MVFPCVHPSDAVTEKQLVAGTSTLSIGTSSQSSDDSGSLSEDEQWSPQAKKKQYGFLDAKVQGSAQQCPRFARPVSNGSTKSSSKDGSTGEEASTCACTCGDECSCKAHDERSVLLEVFSDSDPAQSEEEEEEEWVVPTVAC